MRGEVFEQDGRVAFAIPPVGRPGAIPFSLGRVWPATEPCGNNTLDAAATDVQPSSPDLEKTVRQLDRISVASFRCSECRSWRHAANTQEKMMTAVEMIHLTPATTTMPHWPTNAQRVEFPPHKSLTSLRGFDQEARNTIEVRYGTQRIRSSIGGMTVGKVKRSLHDQWGIAYFCDPVVNGRVVKAATVLWPGDHLVFRRFGFKGAVNDQFVEADLVIAKTLELQRIVTEERNIEVAVRRAVQFCIERFGPPGSSEMVLFHAVLGRIAASVQLIADRIDPLLASPPHETEGSLATAQPQIESPYFLAPEAARYLRTKIQTIYDWVKDGKLHPEPGFEGRLVFTRESLDRFARTRRRGR